MKTNDLKKGMRIQLRNGWYGTVYDNARGNTRMCEVEGDFTEIGSIFSHDIIRYFPEGPSQPIIIEHTPAQLKLRETVEGMF